MKDLNATYENCKSLLESMGIECGEITSVTVNPRFTRSLGRCHRSRHTNFHPWRYRLEFSPVLMTDACTQKEFENTMLHELLHTVEDCFDHTGKWKRLAESVNARYGYHIQRCSDNAAAQAYHAAHKVNRYTCVCEKCGHEWHYQRMCNTVKYANRYTHTGCGGHLKRI